MKLRPLQPSDWPVIQRWYENEKTLQATAIEPPDRTKPMYAFAVTLNDGTLVGVADLFNIDVRNGKAEAGLALPERRGRGMSYRVGRRVLRFSFETLGLNRIVARIPEGNTRSLRLVQLLKFTR